MVKIIVKPDGLDIQTAAALLRGSGWLSATPVAFADAIFDRCQWLAYPAGAIVSHGGDNEGGMFGLGRGEMLVTPSVGAADIPAIHVVCAPYWFGFNPLLNGLPRNVSMEAREPCIIALVPQQALTELLSERPEWWQWISLNLAEALALTSQIAAELLIPDSRRRCIAVLLRIAGCRKQGAGPNIANVGQAELAGMAHMARETAGATLRELEALGAVKLGYRNITIINPAVLRAAVDP